jgi:hypothetical protein
MEAAADAAAEGSWGGGVVVVVGEEGEAGVWVLVGGWMGELVLLEVVEVEMTEMASSLRMSSLVFWARARAQAAN